MGGRFGWGEGCLLGGVIFVRLRGASLLERWFSLVISKKLGNGKGISFWNEPWIHLHYFLPLSADYMVFPP